MSGVGLDWYKREPVAYLGDVQGLTAKEHAVYAVVIDLLYIHGGTIRNDPKFISGWISDMGAAAVRVALASLAVNSRITLTVSETEITQKRAQNEVKTKRKQVEKSTDSGRIGGERSAESRRKTKENKTLGEASASTETQPEKRREEKTSSPEADFYQEYLKAHPKPADTPRGEELWAALLAEGVEPETIIAAARQYADASKQYSSEKYIQHSDNFLSPDRGKWRAHIPKPRAKPKDTLKFYADWVNSEKHIPQSAVSQRMIDQLVSSDLVSRERLKERKLI